MNVRLSIVLPCYNVEKYIERCLESIYTQDIAESDYEVIVVNDFSPDNSTLIVKKWQLNHANIRLVEHTYNKGLGATRNTGLKNANGRYIWFIDTDDFIEPNCLSDVLIHLETDDLDIVSFNLLKQNEDLTFQKDVANGDTVSDVLSGSDFLDSYYQPETLSSCSRVFKVDYLLENNFYFEEGVYWDDADWVVKSIYCARRVKYIPEYLYYYCFNGASISRSISWKKYADMVKMGYRKVLFAEIISETSPDLSCKIAQDGAWNATVIKKILFLTNKDRLLFYQEITGDIQRKMGNYVLRKELKFLYKAQGLSIFLLLFLSPLLRLMKKNKGYL